MLLIDALRFSKNKARRANSLRSNMRDSATLFLCDAQQPHGKNCGLMLTALKNIWAVLGFIVLFFHSASFESQTIVKAIKTLA